MTEQFDQSTVRDIKVLERKVHDLELRVQRALESRLLDDLDDVEVPYGRADLTSGYVLTLGTGGPASSAGLLARFLPSVAGDMAVSEAVGTFTDTRDESVRSFDETGYYSWETLAFPVAPNSFQSVLVTINVAISETSLGEVLAEDGVSTVTVGFPTPWAVTATDTENAISYYGNGTGSCGVTIPMWLHNDSDDEAYMTVTLQVDGVPVSFVNDGYDATVEARVESVYSLNPLTP